MEINGHCYHDDEGNGEVLLNFLTPESFTLMEMTLLPGKDSNN